MRLHHLEITAFGPFAGTVAVDLDALAEGGLFLLCGPTGAGKSSVLDAICFALYGAVPGERNGARHLRSDQAAPEVAPRVVLEATLSGRRFRFTRSPAWERPKKRGEGLTLQQATVLVEERLDGAWSHLTGRIDDAGHLVARLVGLTLTQFCQVVLLPQGEFQRFLRAGGDDRQKLLQSIFRTGRFGDVERWLAEHRRALRQESLALQRPIAEAVSRASEAAGLPLPADARFDEPAGAVAAPDLERWVAAAEADAADHAAEAGVALAPAVAAAAAAADALRAAEDLTAARRRQEQLAARQAVLLAREEEAAAQRRRVEEARRAAPVLGLVTTRHRAAEAARRADRALADGLRLLGPVAAETAGTLVLTLDDVVDPLVQAALDEPAVRAALADSRARCERCADAVDRQAELARLEAASERAAEELAVLDARDAALDEAEATLPAHIARVRAALRADSAAVEAARLAEHRRAGAAAALAAAERVEELAQVLTEAEAALTTAREETQRRREHWLDLRERRLDGMAAEIALDLAVGDACPVCGSCDHPRPAAAGAGAPDAAAERAARRSVDDAEVHQQARVDAVRAAAENLARAREAAQGTDAAGWRTVVTDLDDLLVELTAQVAGLAGREAELAELEARQQALADDRRVLAERRATLAAERQQHAARIGELTRVVARVRAVEGSEPADALTALTATVEQWEHVLDARLDLDRAAAHLAETHELALAEAVAHGFDDLDAAAAAGLPHAELVALEEQLRSHDEELATTREQLADPALVAAAAAPPADLDRLRAEAEETARAASALRTRHDVAVRRHARLEALAADLRAALAAWAPVRDRYDVADRVATLASGRSADNRVRLGLAAYVVSWRLGQVVAAANQRLAPMTAARYSLEQESGALRLLVRDEWSGELRDPATLSGGETFLVSLALALGLADVVAGESAADGEGSDLETLFVDEGFGSLDAETLDDVMDTLDELREGGRVVGVVSHVSELRTRIPTQLQVAPSRAGSRLSIVHADG
ncbi:AAA family ATPase [Nocardioides zeae]